MELHVIRGWVVLWGDCRLLFRFEAVLIDVHVCKLVVCSVEFTPKAEVAFMEVHVTLGRVDGFILGLEDLQPCDVVREISVLKWRPILYLT